MQIVDDFETGKFQGAPDLEKRKRRLQEAAKNTLDGLKKRSPQNAVTPWKLLSSTKALDEKWFPVRKDRVQLPKGTIVDDYFVWEAPRIVGQTAYYASKSTGVIDFFIAEDVRFKAPPPYDEQEEGEVVLKQPEELLELLDAEELLVNDVPIAILLAFRYLKLPIWR